MEYYHMVVVGGGPGGYAAALYAARSGLSVAVLEQLSAGGQMATTSIIENYPGFPDGIDGFTLGERMREQAEKFGAVTRYVQVNGAELSGDEKFVHTSEGDIRADTVVLATGAYPRKLGLPGEDEFSGRGVAYCATCDGMMFRGKTVVINGGGNTAVEDALYLSKLCKKVYLVHRRKELRASAVYRKALDEHGVEIIWNCKITQLLGEKRLTGVQVEDVVTGSQRVVECDGLFVAIGRVPDTELFRKDGILDEAGYVIADESCRANIPGVFAVGDVRTKAVRQVVTAVADGANAAHYAEDYLLQQKARGQH